MRTNIASLVLLILIPFCIRAAEPATTASTESLAPFSSDEPFAKSYSLGNAANYLDRAALDWQRSHACTSCHTMIPYLMTRGAISAVSPQSTDVRAFFEGVAAGKIDPMPAYECKDVGGAVSIGIAVALAMNDRMTTGRLHPLTRKALDKMWTLQRSDGSWEWPFRDTPPPKIREHYGVTLAAIAAGTAPDGYAGSPAAKSGLDRIRQYLAQTPPASLHERAMLVWASTCIEGLLSSTTKEDSISAIIQAQRPDGGWSLASFVDNTAGPVASVNAQAAKLTAETGYRNDFLVYAGRDAVYKSSLASDGYATGFAIHVARQAGVTASDARLQRGVAWLKSHQRESGRWFTPSQAWHTQHLISNAGTAYAVMALAECGELQRHQPESSSAAK